MARPRTRPLRIETLREQATTLLEKHRIKRAPVPVEKIASVLGARVRYEPFEGELAGMLVRTDGQIVIGVNANHSTNRQRFTIAHECGHLLFHEGDVHIDKSFRVNWRDENSSLAIDPHEIDANRFAAELLMPYDMIIADLKKHDIDLEDDLQDQTVIKQLADKYQVSPQAMMFRITNILNRLF